MSVDACSIAPPAQAMLSAQRAAALADVFKVLSDPIRVRLLHHISASCCSSVCVCHIPSDLGISQPTLSYHLGKLITAGLITRQMHGRWAHYTATADGLAAVRTFIDEPAPSRDGFPNTCASPQRS